MFGLINESFLCTKKGASKKKKSGEKKEAHVSVTVRIRPLNGLEKKTGQFAAWGYMKNQVYLTAKPKGKRNAQFANSFFTLDKVFSPKTSNEAVFEGVGGPMMDDVMSGFHGVTLFQTVCYSSEQYSKAYQ